MVFPAMRHSRFEHSLGTYYLFERIRDKVAESYLTEDQVKLLGELALYHDIGHLPFSHTFEFSMDILKYLDKDKYNEILKKFSGSQKLRAKLHEYIGIEILKKMGKAELANLMKIVYMGPSDAGQNKQENLQRIAQLILNSKDLDIDRLDYLQRDSYYSGAKYGYLPIDRLWDFEIHERNGNFAYLYKYKSLDDLEHYFLARFHMYHSIYNHCVVEIYNRIMAFLIAKMIADSLIPTSLIYDTDEVIYFTEDLILWKLKELHKGGNTEYEHFYKAIYERNRYGRAMLTGDEATTFKSYLDMDNGKRADEVYNELANLNGKAVIGVNEIEMKPSNIVLERKGVYINLEDINEFNVPSKRIKVCIGVRDKQTEEKVKKLFDGISLEFRNT
ncbi:HD domain-containing protein [Metallosphaera hakonensis]|uniref:HD domain-containing protein n=1 Tax=Metallosphaera hakonensis TaxID=79601 RepID=UPI0014433D0D|nr:HD domain-containing protein [Metallosphaera hakonensis]